MKLPQEYLLNMKTLLKEEYDDYLNSFNEDKIHSLRINTSKISVEKFLKNSPFKLIPIPWTNDGFYFDSKENVTKHPYYYAGLYYIQEASAMLPAEVLEINENDKVLDACAAPGGKSLKIANKLNNTGLLFSNDISISRAQVLLKTLENAGISNAFIMAEDLNNLDRFENYFDKILLDAPCSGEGMFRKQNELINSWTIKSNEYYADIQKKLILKALKLLKPGGKLVYSTCTFSIKENEEVIEYALNMCPDLKILPIKKYPGFKNGLTKNTINCARLYPHNIKGEGHFVAYLQKEETLDKQLSEDNNSYLEFENFNLNFKYQGKLMNRENKYYFEPETNINLAGLRIIRSGLYLGEYKHQKFEPSIALALVSDSLTFNNVLNLNIEDNRVIKYLKCETLDVKDKYLDSLVLVKVNGFPLGFGIINKGILKNKYQINYRYK